MYFPKYNKELCSVQSVLPVGARADWVGCVQSSDGFSIGLQSWIRHDCVLCWNVVVHDPSEVITGLQSQHTEWVSGKGFDFQMSSGFLTIAILFRPIPASTNNKTFDHKFTKTCHSAFHVYNWLSLCALINCLTQEILQLNAELKNQAFLMIFCYYG